MKYINPTKISILDLEQSSVGGWAWYHHAIDPAGIKHEGAYRTNVLGDGLYRDIPGNPRQILGNMQFALYGDRKAVYQQIRRWIIKQYRMPLD